MPPEAFRLAVNPNNKKQRYVLWTNGRIDEHGGAVPVPQTQDVQGEFQEGTAPIIGSQMDDAYVCRALQITDWTKPSGYVGDVWGRVFGFGDAVTPPFGTQPVSYGFPAPYWHDYVFNPNGNGEGYALAYNSVVASIGGAVDVADPGYGGWYGAEFDAWRLVMPDYNTKKYFVLNTSGKRNPRTDWAGVGQSPTDAYLPMTPTQTGFWGPAAGPLPGMHRGGYATAAKIYDNLNTNNSHGFMLASNGWIYSLQAQGTAAPPGTNSTQLVYGEPNHPGWEYARDLAILDSGLSTTPLRLAVLTQYGTIQEFISAAAPVATAEVTDPTTTTTRPVIVLGFSTVTGEAADYWQVRVFTSAQYGAGGFDPATSANTWSKDISMPTAQDYGGSRVGVDLANGTYRAYVRVRTTADVWSAWAFDQWVQNVTPPATPSLTVTPGTQTTGNLVSLTAASTPTGGRYGVEYQDAGSSVWRYVRDADQLTPGGGPTFAASITDYEFTYGVQRSYRSRQYVPDDFLVGAYSTTQNATVQGTSWTLLNVFGGTSALLVAVRELSWDRKVVVGEFYPDGRTDAVIVSSPTGVKTPKFTLPLRTITKAAYDALVALLITDTVLLVRDPFSRSYYMRVSGDLSFTQLHASKLPSETTPTRHAHEIDVPVTTVTRPLSGPTSGDFALLD